MTLNLQADTRRPVLRFAEARAARGASIKKAREDRGFTYAEVEAATGVRLPTLKKWERGENGLRLDPLLRLCEMYQLTVSELIGEV